MSACWSWRGTAPQAHLPCGCVAGHAVMGARAGCAGPWTGLWVHHGGLDRWSRIGSRTGKGWSRRERWIGGAGHRLGTRLEVVSETESAGVWLSVHECPARGRESKWARASLMDRDAVTFTPAPPSVCSLADQQPAKRLAAAHCWRPFATRLETLSNVLGCVLLLKDTGCLFHVGHEMAVRRSIPRDRAFLHLQAASWTWLVGGPSPTFLW